MPFYSWSYSGSCGKVDYSASIDIASSGLWHWTGHEHDNSTYYGDECAMSFIFGASTSDGKHLGVETGDVTLGAEYSGPNVDWSFAYGGMNMDIKKHFGAYVDGSYAYHVWVADDFANQIAKPAAEWAAKVAITALLAP